MYYNVVRASSRSALAIALVAPVVTPSLQELAASKAPNAKHAHLPPESFNQRSNRAVPPSAEPHRRHGSDRCCRMCSLFPRRRNECYGAKSSRWWLTMSLVQLRSFPTVCDWLWHPVYAHVGPSGSKVLSVLRNSGCGA